MVELTDREKQIVMIKFIVHGNGPFSNTPVPQRVKMLEAAIKVMGLEWNEQEMFDLGEAVIATQQQFLDSGMGWMEKNQDAIDAGLKIMGTGMDRFKFK